MTKLIGTNPNQVPSNADLGTAAFMDSEDLLKVRDSGLASIETTIPKTAVDVFVYDTTLDSDGGQWRNRVSHTTWYNEELNTATRGSRKEFPSVAILVIEQYKLTIYDGDEDSLPMWMVIERGTDTNPTMLWDGNNGNVATSVRAVNGLIAWSTSTAGSFGMNMIDERWLYLYQNQTNFGWRHDGGGIVNRNLAVSSRVVHTAFFGHTTASNHNSITMKVLPGASIDPANGLEIPTIGIGTAAGTTVIQHDLARTTGHATASVGSNYNRSYDLSFMDDGCLTYYFDRGYNKRNVLSSWRPSHWSNNYSSFDFNGGNRFAVVPSSGVSTIGGSSNGTSESFQNISTYKTRIAAGKSLGLTILDINNDPKKDIRANIPQMTIMSANIDDEFNTGWMIGDTVTALLCESQQGELIGGDLAPAGTVTSVIGEQNSTTGWGGVAASIGSTSAQSLNGNSLSIQCSGNGGGAYFTADCQAGITYQISFSVYVVANTGGNFQLEVGDALDGSEYLDQVFPVITDAWQTLNYSFTPTTTEELYFLFRESGSGTPTAYLDNVSLTRTVPDRSRRGNIGTKNSLHVYGALDRTPVAPGSDLVAYSGFSASNRLVQPYNADLQFGTQRFSIMFWVKMDSTSSSGTVVQMGPSDAVEAMVVYINSNYGIYFDTGNGAQWSGFSDANDKSRVMDGEWHHIVVTAEADEGSRIYLDGISRPVYTSADTSASFPSGLPELGWYLNVGNGRGAPSALNTPLGGSTCLIKISSDIPTSDTIYKIYQDEWKMFRPNAKCLLASGDKNVRAIDWDNQTGKLHIGQASGRQVFEGLVKTESTTDPVYTAISAVNDYVVEE